MSIPVSYYNADVARCPVLASTPVFVIPSNEQRRARFRGQGDTSSDEPCRFRKKRRKAGEPESGYKKGVAAFFFSQYFSLSPQHITARHSAAQHSTAPHSTAQHSTALHCNALQFTALHCTFLYCLVLPCPVRSFLVNN